MSKRYLLRSIALILSLVFCALTGPAIAQKSSFPLIDVHAHLLPDRNLRFDRAVASAVRLMDQNGIGTTVLMSPPRNRRIKLNYDIANFRKAIGKYPGRFVFLGGGGTLNPTLHSYGNASRVTEKMRRNFAAQARKLIKQGANGFGEIGGLHISLARQHGYSFVPVDHPLLKVLADVAAEHDLPIDLHMDAVARKIKPPSRLASFPNNPKTFPATLGALEKLLAHNRKAKIVWAHGGTDHLGDFSAATIGSLMDAHPNLFVSLKVSGPAAPVHNKLFSPGMLEPDWFSLLSRHSDRFLIGTDNFYADPDTVGPGKEFARRAQPRTKATLIFLSLLPADLARKIGRDNATRLYKLSAKQAPEVVPPGPVAAPAPPSAPSPPSSRAGGKGLCKDGNMAHCRIACRRGMPAACARLKRGR